MLQCETLTPSLPDDIILDILLRLPVSSVTRFNSVCKCWHSLIRSRRFIEMHLCRGLQTDDRLCLLASLHPRGLSINCRYINKSLSFVSKKKKVVWLAPSSSHTLSSLFLPPHYSRCCDSDHGPIFMGSCNDLLCFNLCCERTLKLQTFMWNPATGAFRFMSEDDVAAGDVCDETPPEFKFTGYICGFGFGYDSSVDDYKIVRLVQYADHESFVQVNLLTIGSNKLRRFQLPVRGFFWSEVGVLLHGSLHWLMCRRGSEYYILRFNLETEKLDELIVQIPHPSQKEEAYHTSTISFVEDLSIVDGKLYVIAVYLKMIKNIRMIMRCGSWRNMEWKPHGPRGSPCCMTTSYSGPGVLLVGPCTFPEMEGYFLVLRSADPGLFLIPRRKLIGESFFHIFGQGKSLTPDCCMLRVWSHLSTFQILIGDLKNEVVQDSNLNSGYNFPAHFSSLR